MHTSDQIDKIAAALVKVQAAMQPAVKDSENPHFRSKYADLSAVWAACRAPLTEQAIFVSQEATSDEGSVYVSTRLTHASGQWVEFGPLAAPLVKKDAQSVGSCVSYLRRYSLSAAIGVVTE